MSYSTTTRVVAEIGFWSEQTDHDEAGPFVHEEEFSLRKVTPECPEDGCGMDTGLCPACYFSDLADEVGLDYLLEGRTWPGRERDAGRFILHVSGYPWAHEHADGDCDVGFEVSSIDVKPYETTTKELNHGD